MPFSSLLTTQYQDLVNDQMDQVIFNEIKELDEFYVAAQSLIDPSKSESKNDQADIKGLKELIDNGFDKYVTGPDLEAPAYSPKSKTTPEGKELEVKMSKTDIAREAREEFEKIMVDSIRTQLNDLKAMTPEQKTDYIKLQKIKHPFAAALKSLSPFYSDPKMGSVANEFKSDIEELSSAEATEKNLDIFNKKLEKFLNESKGAKETDDFRKVVNSIFQTLPHNVTDLGGSLEAIEPKSRIVTADRYQFDITSLVGWINSSGKYQNPTTRQIFSPADQQRIKKFAKKKELKIEIGHVFHTEEHPAMLAGALSALQNQDQHSSAMFNLASFAMGAALEGHPDYSQYLRSSHGHDVSPIAMGAALGGHRDYAEHLHTNYNQPNANPNARGTALRLSQIAGIRTAGQGRLGESFYVRTTGSRGVDLPNPSVRRTVNDLFNEHKRQPIARYGGVTSQTGLQNTSFLTSASLRLFGFEERKAPESPTEAVKYLLEENSRNILLQQNSQAMLRQIANLGSAPARLILENESLCNGLLREEKSTVLKEIANTNARTAQCILESKPLRSLLLNGSAKDNATFLHNLAKKDEAYANIILSDRDVLRDIILTPENEAEKAERLSYWIEKNPKLVGVLNLFDEPFRSVVLQGSMQDQAKRLELMACFCNTNQVKRILEEKPLREKLLQANTESKEPQQEIANRLKQILINNHSLAELILKDPSLRNILFQGNDAEKLQTIRDLACSDPTTFGRMLIEADLRKMLLQGNSAQQAETLKLIARSQHGFFSVVWLYDESDLREILLKDADKAENLALLCQGGARAILEDQSMRDILLDGDSSTKARRLTFIASSGDDNARLILEEKSPYREIILSGTDADQTNRLEAIAMSPYLGTGRTVLEDKVLCAKLLNGTPDQQVERLVTIASSPSSDKVAYILESKPLREKLLQGDATVCAERLVRIASSNPQTAQLILESDELRQALLASPTHATLPRAMQSLIMSYLPEEKNEAPRTGTGLPEEKIVRLEKIASELIKKHPHHPVITTINNLSKEISAPFFAPPPPQLSPGRY